MSYFLRSFLFLLAVSTSFSTIQAQDVWVDDIYPLLTTNCAGSGCHSGDRPDFDVSQPAATLYQTLVTADPKNPQAAADGLKYIDSGFPESSLLLLKVANCLDGALFLDPTYGGSMPPNGVNDLAEAEVELIRQWVIAGAPETGSGDGDYIRKDLIDEFYSTNKTLPRMVQPEPPLECDGFQVHMGPIFLRPGEEEEFFQKYDLRLDDDIEVNRLEVIFNDFSHHFILRKFRPGTAQNWPEGITYLNPVTAFDSDKDFVLAWQENQDIELPDGTAYFWEETSVLDLNYHLKNYDNENLMAGEVYINVYTQPKGTAEKQMKAELVNNIFALPADPDPQRLTATAGLPNGGNVSLWNITSHTHERGVDFDVFLRENGQKTDQIYEGMMDYSAAVPFNTGVFDWEHPPVLFLEPFLDMSPYQGVVYEAEYINPDRFRTFGFTTDDEMMIIYLNYVDGTYDLTQAQPYVSNCTGDAFVDPCSPDVSINDRYNYFAQADFNISPNPFQGSTIIDYKLTEWTDVKVEVFDLMGRKVATLADDKQHAGDHSIEFNPEEQAKGTYFVRLSLNGQQVTKKVLQFN